MKGFLYQCVSFLSKGAGSWILVAYVWIVSTGYFLFAPLRVRNSVRFYRILFPGRGGIYHLWCAWRQFHNFADVFLDRFLLQESSDISYTSSGWEHIGQSRRETSGGIILMSHMGSWEIAAHLMRRKDPGLRLLLYMGAKHREQIERIQKEGLSQSGIKIIAVDSQGGSPLDIVEGIKFIDSGGLVSMTGDLVWKEDQRTVPVNFLGHEVRLPAAPHVLALVSGAPLFVFFAFREGKGRYRFSLSEPIYIKAPSRTERTEAIRASAQKYADVLEETLRKNPFQWYHFEPFLDSKPTREKESLARFA